jgi:chorismate mutase
MTPEIEDWRRHIDTLEDQIISLLNERASYAAEIGKIKRTHALPVLDATREQEILVRVGAKSQGPLSASAVQNIFRVIMAETRLLEAEINHP